MNYNQKGQIIIQNDVWIGQNCTIMPGIIIHNGTVVAANSHVVSDVPPYAIVGGNPAKIIKYRFSQELIDKLLTIQWWNWSNDEIKNNIKYFNEDIVRCKNNFRGGYIYFSLNFIKFILSYTKNPRQVLMGFGVLLINIIKHTLNTYIVF